MRVITTLNKGAWIALPGLEQLSYFAMPARLTEMPQPGWHRVQTAIGWYRGTYGTYRTKTAILKEYDAMQGAMRTGVPYKG